MDASIILLAIVVVWLLFLFPHWIRRHEQFADAGTVHVLPKSVRVLGMAPAAGAASASHASPNILMQQTSDVKAMITSSNTTEAGAPSAAPGSPAAPAPEGLAANRTLRPARPQSRSNTQSRSMPQSRSNTQSRSMPASSARPSTAAREAGRPVASASIAATHENRARVARRGALKARLRLLGALFLGLLAATIVTAVVAAFGAIAWAFPVAAVVLAGADLLLIKGIRRSLAAGERVVRREESVTKIVGARAEAPRAEADRAATSPAATVVADVAVEAPAVAPADERDLAEPAAAAKTEVAAPAESAAAAQAPARTPAAKSSVVWSPVPVPRPQYVNAAKAERAEPAALVVDASVRDKVIVPAAELEAVAQEWVEAPGKRPEVEDVRPVRVNKTAAAVNNLNDVLQRRRAVGE